MFKVGDLLELTVDFCGTPRGTICRFIGNIGQDLAHVEYIDVSGGAAIYPMFLIPSVRKVNVEPGCQHEWQNYRGLTQQFEYCTKCDERKAHRGLFE